MYYSTVLGKKEEYYSKHLQEEIVDFLGNTFNILDDFDADVLEMEEGYEGRPDLVSDVAYMDEMYVDVICKINGFSNPFEINDVSLIALPTGEHINNFTQIPSEKWRDEDESVQINTPKPVTKSEPHQPNRAIVGDSRFQIDKGSGIVIY